MWGIREQLRELLDSWRVPNMCLWTALSSQWSLQVMVQIRVWNVFHQCTFHPIVCYQSQLSTPKHPTALQEPCPKAKGRSSWSHGFCGSKDWFPFIWGLMFFTVLRMTAQMFLIVCVLAWWEMCKSIWDCGIGTWQMAINRTNSASGKLTAQNSRGVFVLVVVVVVYFEVNLFDEIKEIEVKISKVLWGWSPSFLICALIFQFCFPTSVCLGIGLHPFMCIASDVWLIMAPEMSMPDPEAVLKNLLFSLLQAQS